MTNEFFVFFSYFWRLLTPAAI